MTEKGIFAYKQTKINAFDIAATLKDEEYFFY